MKYFFTILAISPILLLSGCGNLDAQKVEDPSNLVYEEYPGLEDLLLEYAGTPLVLNSWATWCPFCVRELPDFATIQAEFGDQVQIIAINRAESTSRMATYTTDLGVESALLFMTDNADSFYRNIGGFSMPETLFINANGETMFHNRGQLQLEEIRSQIQQLL